jgi:hypothetical protein
VNACVTRLASAKPPVSRMKLACVKKGLKAPNESKAAQVLFPTRLNIAFAQNATTICSRMLCGALLSYPSTGEALLAFAGAVLALYR